jgi:uncharacterized protein (AIM24 family)
MAEFKVHHLEGMHYVDVHLDHEMVRCESGALNYLIGEVDIHSQLIPSVGGLFSSLLSGESVYRPTYTGTGIITLESSLGGFHVLELGGESWILEKGAYWASEGSVDLQFFRERLLTSMWAGEGLVYLQTKVSGQGKVVVTTKGPVEEIVLEEGQKIVVDGQCVIGRSASVSFKIRRPTKNFMGRFTAGEPFVRTYHGPGKVLMNPTFYWRYFMAMQRQKEI